MNVDSRNTPTSPSEASPELSGEAGPNPELLSSLGRLVRGLSALFWGLPVALVACVQTAKSDWLRPFGVFPALITTGLLYYGLSLLESFQQQERVWRVSVHRAKAIAIVNIGFCPFLFFWNKIPSNPYFEQVVHATILSGLVFLFALNPMLLRLALMLPDETLRVETRLFTNLNRYLLGATVVLLSGYFVSTEFLPQGIDRFVDLLGRLNPFPQRNAVIMLLFDRGVIWLILFLVLLVPVAMTMALIWKVKEVILSSVFGDPT